MFRLFNSNQSIEQRLFSDLSSGERKAFVVSLCQTEKQLDELLKVIQSTSASSNDSLSTRLAQIDNEIKCCSRKCQEMVCTLDDFLTPLRRLSKLIKHGENATERLTNYLYGIFGEELITHLKTLARERMKIQQEIKERTVLNNSRQPIIEETIKYLAEYMKTYYAFPISSPNNENHFTYLKMMAQHFYSLFNNSFDAASTYRVFTSKKAAMEHYSHHVSSAASSSPQQTPPFFEVRSSITLSLEKEGEFSEVQGDKLIHVSSLKII